MSKDISITRYNCTVGDRRGEFGECMEKRVDGRWVTYEQHARQINHLQKEIKLLKERNK